MRQRGRSRRRRVQEHTDGALKCSKRGIKAKETEGREQREGGTKGTGASAECRERLPPSPPLCLPSSHISQHMRRAHMQARALAHVCAFLRPDFVRLRVALSLQRACVRAYIRAVVEHTHGRGEQLLQKGHEGGVGEARLQGGRKGAASRQPPEIRGCQRTGSGWMESPPLAQTCGDAGRGPEQGRAEQGRAEQSPLQCKGRPVRLRQTTSHPSWPRLCKSAPTLAGPA